jgi:hypothetical protein
MSSGIKYGEYLFGSSTENISVFKNVVFGMEYQMMDIVQEP